MMKSLKQTRFMRSSKSGKICGGQVNIEITFGMIIIVILMLATIRVFFWVSDDIAARRIAHETTLTEGNPGANIDDNYKQIRPRFYEGIEMDGVAVNSEIFGGTNRMGNL